jgi:hypothetical protein
MELDSIAIITLVVAVGALIIGLGGFMMFVAYKGSVDRLTTGVLELKYTTDTTGSELHEVRNKMTLAEEIEKNNYRVKQDELVTKVAKIETGAEMDRKIETERHRTQINETMQMHLNSHAQGGAGGGILK